MKFFYITVCVLFVSFSVFTQRTYALAGKNEYVESTEPLKLKRKFRQPLGDITNISPTEETFKKMKQEECPSILNPYVAIDNSANVTNLIDINKMSQERMDYFINGLDYDFPSIKRVVRWYLYKHGILQQSDLEDTATATAKDLWEWVSDGIFIYPDRVADGMIEWLSTTLIVNEPEFFKQNVLNVLICQGWSSHIPCDYFRGRFKYNDMDEKTKQDSLTFFRQATGQDMIDFADRINKFSQKEFDMLNALCNDTIENLIIENLKTISSYVRDEIIDFFDIVNKIHKKYREQNED